MLYQLRTARPGSGWQNKQGIMMQRFRDSVATLQERQLSEERPLHDISQSRRMPDADGEWDLAENKKNKEYGQKKKQSKQKHDKANVSETIPC